MKYEPCGFDHLSVKNETWEHDFISTDIVTEIESNDSEEMFLLLEEAEQEGCSVKMSFSEQVRDGCFDEHQLFAVYEKEDVEGLIAKLTESLKVY